MALRNAFENVATDASVQDVKETLQDGTTKVRLHDEAGAPFDATNPLPVDVGASINIDNLSVNFDSLISTQNVISAPLGAGQMFTGTWEDVHDYASIACAIHTDAASATNGAVIDFSTDGTTIVRSVATTIPANFGAFFELSPEAQYFRIRYTNGPVAQTFIRAQVILRFNPGGLVQQPLGSQTTDFNVAGMVKSHAAGRIYSGPAMGAYAPIQVDTSGQQYVRGPLTNTELRAAPVPVDGSGVTQPVSGSVNVGNFPATQPVSGAVSVTNLPATQPVSGSVDVSNFPSNQAVTVSNFPAVQSVSGSVIVTNFPGTQPVSGPLTDAQLRASRVPVDASLPATYPLPQAQVDALTAPGTQTVTGTVALHPDTLAALETINVDFTGEGTLATETTLSQLRDRFPLATLLSDTIGNPTLSQIASFGMLWDHGASQWERMRAARTDHGGIADGAMAVVAHLRDGTGSFSQTWQANTIGEFSSGGAGFGGTQPMLYDETSGNSGWRRQKQAPGSDGVGPFGHAAAAGLLFNGTNWDRARTISAPGHDAGTGAGVQAVGLIALNPQDDSTMKLRSSRPNNGGISPERVLATGIHAQDGTVMRAMTGDVANGLDVDVTRLNRDSGTMDYAAGTSIPGTGLVIDIPANARLRFLTIDPSTVADATFRIGTKPVVTVRAGSVFAREFTGVALGADVTLGGTIDSYYVEWEVQA